MVLLITLISQILSPAAVHAQAAGAVVESVSVPASGYYEAGDVLSFTVDFSEIVVVEGTPSLPLAIGGTIRQAAYVGGSGTTELDFAYTLLSGDVDLDGIQLGGPIEPNGGNIESIAGDPADLTLNNIGDTSNVFVRAGAPVVLSTSVIGNPPPNASDVTFEIVFSEAVTGLLLNELVLTTTDTAVATLSDLRTSDNITYRVTASGISGRGTLRLDVPANSVVGGGRGNPAYTSGTPWTVGLSSDAELTGLLPSKGTLTPAFDRGVLSYSIFLANDATEITLTPTASEANARIRVNGAAVSSGAASAPFTLAVGSTTIDVVVTAQDGTTTRTYRVNVTRAPASSADLTGLVPSTGNLNPAFDPTTYSYTLSVAHTVDSIALTPTAADAAATITINGSVVASGNTSAPLPLSEGPNRLSIVVVAKDGAATRSYTVDVIRSNPVPTAASRIIQVVAGTTVSVDLTEGASGAPYTAAALTSRPDRGAGVVHLDAQQKRLTFDASPTFVGSVGVGFTLSNAAGTSMPATITFAVIARPDPSKDPEVIGLLRAQADTAKRFAQYQTRNFNNRLEQLHDEGDRRRSSLDIRLGYRQASANGDRNAAQRRLEQMKGLNTDPTAPSLLGYAPKGAPGTDPEAATQAPDSQGSYVGSYAIWAGGFVDFTERDKGGLDIGSTAVGMSAGVDYRFSEGFIGGFGVGYGHDSSDVAGNGTESRASAYSAAIYGSYKPASKLFIDGLIGGSWLDFNSERFVAATGDFAAGGRGGRQLFGSLTAAYEFRDRKWLISPYGRFELSRSWLDGFAEKGGGTYGLTYGDQVVDTAAGVLGVRASYAFDLAWGTLTPGLRTEFTHDFAGSSRARLGYTDIGTLPYLVEAEAAGEDYATIGLSLDAALFNYWALGLEYRTALGSGRTDHAIGLTVGARF
ncbi:MAG TPA: autotransporter domain-containing protein [Rhizobiaceae bacterium]|nr:autotransporter domain-containing protein [Rhizobiaceae bacterium]